ncbi:hypothetical protein OB955_05565 [Halobacteria archaeon AArc-m2/3/4]|uniref:Uncharacterized protein n=1 Tax=Natronoglomus mannanivorans TaxID=2979990 RepID=A0AAP2Z2B4_9EURY|nr:hypothetical protein [Halobacteria archaeon AArc-xg1-1]MCU4972201.1 hypothetical protein [Halobacteria archaeon AArc-m2/3/4]
MRDSTRRRTLYMLSSGPLVVLSGCLETFNSRSSVRYCGVHITNIDAIPLDITVRVRDGNDPIFEQELNLEPDESTLITPEDGSEYYKGDLILGARIESGDWNEKSLTESDYDPLGVSVYVSTDGGFSTEDEVVISTVPLDCHSE